MAVPRRFHSGNESEEGETDSETNVLQRQRHSRMWDETVPGLPIQTLCTADLHTNPEEELLRGVNKGSN